MTDRRGGAVIAIDPGRDKCGLAAVAADGRLIEKAVMPTGDLPDHLARMLSAAPEVTVIIGGGTSSKTAQAALRRVLPELAIQVVDEEHSTERALERWRDTVPPMGWRRLLPRSLRFPPGPIDDFAAWVLAEYYLMGEGDSIPVSRRMP